MKNDTIRMYLGKVEPKGIVRQERLPNTFMGLTLFCDTSGYYVQQNSCLCSFVPPQDVTVERYEIRTRHHVVNIKPAGDDVKPESNARRIGVYQSGDDTVCEVFPVANCEGATYQELKGASNSWNDLFLLVKVVREGVILPASFYGKKQVEPQQFATYLGFWTRLCRWVKSRFKTPKNTPPH